MNILLINHYAGTIEYGMEFRPYYMAKEWVKMGHNVTIIAASYSHLRRKNPVLSSDFLEENIDGINYLWVKTPEYEGNGIGRIKNMLVFLKRIYFKAKYFAETYKPDLVIASSTYPNDNYIAHKISKIAKAKYFFEVNDLWPLSPMELGGISKFHPFIMALKHGELYSFKHVDAIVSLLPNTKDYMLSQGLKANKWNYIPNGIVVDDCLDAEPLNTEATNVLENLKAKGKTIIGYTGGHAISNSLNTIIDAAKIAENNDSIHFVLVGDGQEKQNLIKQSDGLKNVTFLPPIPKNQIPSILAIMDVLLITWNKSPIYRFGISPNKIFDYMMASKPIIHATDAPNKFVDEADCGFVVEPENPNAVIDAISSIEKLSSERIKEMGDNARDFILKNHDYKVLASNFIKIME